MKSLISNVLKISLFALVCNVYAVDFSKKQLVNLEYAYNYGKYMHYEKENNEMGYIYAALAWKESSAGTMFQGGENHQAYGMFQNYLPTLRARIEQKGLDIEDKYIIEVVSKSKRISADFAKIELEYWLKVRNGNLKMALASYNAGWKWQGSIGYANDVISKANYLKRNQYFANLDG